MNLARLAKSITAIVALVTWSSALAALPTATGSSFTLPEGSAYKLFIPSNFIPSSNMDLIVHFHGDPQTYWNNEKYANLNALVVTVNLGTVSSAYQTPFASNTSLFQSIMDDALNTARSQASISDNAIWRKVAVTSFSAGYAAVREILKQPSYFNRIDDLMMADTIYSSFTSPTNQTPLQSQMADFHTFALDAKNGTKTMILSHSQVLTYTYCNTIQTADDIMQYINVNPVADNDVGLGGIQFYRYTHSGNFTMYGATGDDAAAHSLHLQDIGQWLAQLPLATVPEPGSLALLCIGVLTVLRRPIKR